MKFTFKGEIFPKDVLKGVDIDRHQKRFRIQLKNNQITVEYSGEGRKEEIEKKAETIVKDIVKELAFKSDQILTFNFFRQTFQESHKRHEIELSESIKGKDKVSKGEVRLTVDAVIIREVPTIDVETILSEISTRKSNSILTNAKSHYVKSLDDKLDYDSRGAHLYKSFEELEKVQKRLNVSKPLISKTSGVLQKARHIDKGTNRIPGEFKEKDYNVCKNIIKELIKRYGNYLNGEDISQYKKLNKPDFFN